MSNVPIHMCEGCEGASIALWADGKWYLRTDWQTRVPITHCPYCGVKLEALEPWPPETRVAVLRTMLEGWVEELLRHADKYFMGQLMPTVESIQAILDDR